MIRANTIWTRNHVESPVLHIALGVSGFSKSIIRACTFEHLYLLMGYYPKKLILYSNKFVL